MALGWNYVKPELRSGNAITLVTLNNGAGNLKIKGSVTGWNAAGNFTPKAKWFVYPEATTVYDLNQAIGLTVNDATGAVNQMVQLNGGAPFPEIAAADHVSPIPADQYYKCVVWPGEKGPLAMDPTNYGAPVVRVFCVSETNQGV